MCQMTECFPIVVCSKLVTVILFSCFFFFFWQRLFYSIPLVFTFLLLFLCNYEQQRKVNWKEEKKGFMLLKLRLYRFCRWLFVTLATVFFVCKYFLMARITVSSYAMISVYFPYRLKVFTSENLFFISLVLHTLLECLLTSTNIKYSNEITSLVMYLLSSPFLSFVCVFCMWKMCYNISAFKIQKIRK